MFDNAWVYNKKTSRVYKFCTKLSEVFDMYIDAAMVKLGYCCGQRVCLPHCCNSTTVSVHVLWFACASCQPLPPSLPPSLQHTFHPQVLYCYGKSLCTIPRDCVYYGYQNRYMYIHTVELRDDKQTLKPHFSLTSSGTFTARSVS